MPCNMGLPLRHYKYSWLKNVGNAPISQLWASLIKLTFHWRDTLDISIWSTTEASLAHSTTKYTKNLFLVLCPTIEFDEKIPLSFPYDLWISTPQLDKTLHPCEHLLPRIMPYLISTTECLKAIPPIAKCRSHFPNSLVKNQQIINSQPSRGSWSAILGPSWFDESWLHEWVD